MNPRHIPEGCIGGIALAMVVAALVWCAACPASGTELTLLARASTASGLGYESPSYGIAGWHDAAGTKMTLRTEFLVTSADKAEAELQVAISALAEQRFQLGDGWWIGPGLEYHYDHAGGSERWTLGAGKSDENPETGVGQAWLVRALGEDSTNYNTHGVVARWQALRGKFTWALEFSELAFTLEMEQRWDRRYSVLIGWRPNVE